MKNASLIGLIGAILLVITSLLWFVAPYSAFQIILNAIGYLCIGYYFWKMYKVYLGK